jgi:hypothetical protein
MGWSQQSVLNNQLLVTKSTIKNKTITSDSVAGENSSVQTLMMGANGNCHAFPDGHGGSAFWMLGRVA